MSLNEQELAIPLINQHINLPYFFNYLFWIVFIVMAINAFNLIDGIDGLAIGLGLTLIHLISIPVTNTSVNPARSTSQAIFAGGGAIDQLWLFWVAPIVGAIIAGVVYKYLSPEKE